MEPPPPTPHDDEARWIAALLAARPRARRATAHHEGLSVDAGDDAAVIGDGTAITVDTLVEGVHWDDRLSARDVGFKTLAVSVSDLAAMGARPSWAVLSVATAGGDAAWRDAFAEGLGEALDRWSVRLVGGDTVRTSGPRVVSLTLGGACVAAPITRRGAEAGDDLWVTGTLGLAGAGWQIDDPPAVALEALRRPDPPLAFALGLAEAGLAHAAMDLSDGLGADLPRLCAASGVGARVTSAHLPAHAALGPTPRAHQLTGGEDYQLLLAAPPAAAAELKHLAARHGVRLTAIGHTTDDGTLRLDDAPWPAGWTHFPEASS